jgi:hypothetical protein
VKGFVPKQSVNLAKAINEFWMEIPILKPFLLNQNIQ